MFPYLWRKKSCVNLVKLSAFFLALGGFFAFIIHPGYWKWVFGLDRAYVNDLTWDTIFFSISILYALETVSLPLSQSTPIHDETATLRNPSI